MFSSFKMEPAYWGGIRLSGHSGRITLFKKIQTIICRSFVIVFFFGLQTMFSTPLGPKSQLLQSKLFQDRVIQELVEETRIWIHEHFVLNLN